MENILAASEAVGRGGGLQVFVGLLDEVHSAHRKKSKIDMVLPVVKSKAIKVVEGKVLQVLQMMVTSAITFAIAKYWQ